MAVWSECVGLVSDRVTQHPPSEKRWVEARNPTYNICDRFGRIEIPWEDKTFLNSLTNTLKRRDIVWMNFSPQSGREQAGRRPILGGIRF